MSSNGVRLFLPVLVTNILVFACVLCLFPSISWLVPSTWPSNNTSETPPNTHHVLYDAHAPQD